MTITTEQVERAALLRLEGMPAPWIAEDLDLPPAVVRRIAPLAPEALHEWLSSWAGIRRNPALRALHDEFTPNERFHRR